MNKELKSNCCGAKTLLCSRKCPHCSECLEPCELVRESIPTVTAIPLRTTGEIFVSKPAEPPRPEKGWKQSSDEESQRFWKEHGFAPPHKEEDLNEGFRDKFSHRFINLSWYANEGDVVAHHVEARKLHNDIENWSRTKKSEWESRAYTKGFNFALDNQKDEA